MTVFIVCSKLLKNNIALYEYKLEYVELNGTSIRPLEDRKSYLGSAMKK